MTEQLSFTTGDATWEKLRKRAISDLYWFSAVVLGYSNLFELRPETHAIPLKFVERRTGVPDLDNAPMQLILWPRETGKSSCGLVASAIQLACENPNRAILIANEKQQNSMDFLKSIKHHFETNELLRALFPEVIPEDFKDVEWSSTRATLRRTSGRPEPTFDTIGVGGTVTGKHYDCILCDDLISREVAESIRLGTHAKLNEVNFWVNTLRPLLSQGAQPFPWIRFIGTRWWLGDTYDHIERTFGHGEEPRRFRIKAKLPDGMVVSRDAYRVGDLAVMRIAAIENGEPAFPAIHPADKLAKMREEDPELFACFMMNDPSNAAVRTFQDSWLRYWTRIDNRMLSYRRDDGTVQHRFVSDLRLQMVVDPAFSASGSGARSAIVVVGSDRETGKHLVLEAIAQRVEPKDLVTDILNLAKRYRLTNVYIESVAQQLGFIQFCQQEALNRNVQVNIEAVKPAGRAKDLRIEGLGAYFKSGQLYVNASQHDLLEEYRAFKPGAIYKDLLDALAYAPEHFPVGPTGPTHNPQDRARLQRESYLRTRHLTPA